MAKNKGIYRGCHAECEDYAAFKIAMETAKKTRESKSTLADKEANELLSVGYVRRAKAARRRTKTTTGRWRGA